MTASVRWSEWDDAAFARAQAEDKPVVLDLMTPWSQGCRVMDADVYGDPVVAEALNRDYVAVRVDAERRPDIGDRYQLGGWPTTGFLTPGGLLMGGATILDVDQMRKLLAQLKAGYAANKEKIAEEIVRRDEKIREALQPPSAGVAALSIEVFRKTVRGIVATHDALHGGFGEAPKQPLPASLRVVLQAFHETRGADFATVLVKTLDAMADRGMYDAAAGGFFHYATNAVWSAARTEKLCEVNARLAGLYLDAALVTGRERWLRRALHALEWARRTLLDPERGVFFGSQAGDDEYYGAAKPGRTPPPVDRTIFTTSSAAMASAFLRAAEVTGDPAWAGPALRGLEWLRRHGVRDGAVAHYHDGTARVFHLARDPIALALAELDAHGHTGEARLLEDAEARMEDLLRRFWSDAAGGLVDRAVDAPAQGDLVIPRRSMAETALAAEAFARLWRLTGRDRHRRSSEKLLQSFPDLLDGYGHESAEYALAMDWHLRLPVEVARGPGLRDWTPRRVVRG